MRQKGFTLVELLAVLVILAILAIITIPLVTKILDGSEERLDLTSARMYIKAVNSAILNTNMDQRFTDGKCAVLPSGNLNCDGLEIEVEVSNTLPSDGTILVQDRRIVDVVDLALGEGYFNYDDNGELYGSHKPQTMPAGLYDSNQNLLASWNALVYTYGLDVEGSYTTSDYSNGGTLYSIIQNNSSLTSGTILVIPRAVTYLGDCLFYNCSNLTSIRFESDSLLEAIGEGTFASCSNLTSIKIPSNVEYIGIGAFYQCSGLETVRFEGNILETIEDSVFSYCYNLSNITLPSSLTNIGGYAFSSCNLQSITIPSGVTNIGSGAFAGCGGLSSITMPASVTSIGRQAFSGCFRLSNVTFDNANGWRTITTSISSTDLLNASTAATYLTNTYVLYAWQKGEFVAGLYDFEQNLLADWNTLTNTYGLDVERDYTNSNYNSSGSGAVNYVLDNNHNIASGRILIIGDGVTRIGDYAFRGCNLQRITMPSSVTSIGNSAFVSCENLSSITIPASVTSIGRLAFSGCTHLSDVTFDDTNGWRTISTSISSTDLLNARTASICLTSTYVSYAWQKGEFEFAAGLYNQYGELLADWNTLVNTYGLNIERDYTSSNYSTTDSKSLRGVISSNSNLSGYRILIIEDGITKIGDYALKNCSSLTTVIIPSSVTSIGDNAFGSYNNVNTMTLNTVIFRPNSQLTSIGSYAFYYCNRLANITLPSSLTSIGNQAFINCSNLSSISIPSGVTSIGYAAFSGSGLTSATFENTSSWKTIDDSISSTALGTAQTAATYLKTTYSSYRWQKGEFAPGLYTIGCSELIADWDTLINTYGLDLEKDYTVTSSNASATVEAGSMKNVITQIGASNASILIVGNGITKIGNYALYRCGLSRVILPNGITSIGDYAFYYCNSLWSIVLPNGVTSIGDYAFYYGTNLTNVTIPSSVTSIGQYAFYNCNKIASSFNLPNVTSVGQYAFYRCSSITGFNTTSALTSIGASAFYNCSRLASSFNLPNVTNIGEHAFSGCSSITAVTLLASTPLTIINQGAFYGCSSITSIVIPSSVTIISNYAFSGCSSIATVTINNGLQTINGSAFRECTSLTSIAIPASVTSIGSTYGGDYAFYGCDSLATITVDPNNTVYEDRNSNAIIKKSTNQLIIGCKNTVIPNTVTSIAYYAFAGCRGLTSINIPSSVTSFGGWAFAGCSSLTSFTIPNGTSMGVNVFAGCTSLTSISIPANTTIMQYAFSGCTNLASVTFSANNQISYIERFAFENCTSLTSISIPNGVVSMGNAVFRGCSSLRSISFPASITSINFTDSALFSDCNNLEAITVDSNNTVYEDGNSNAIIDKSTHKLLAGCKTTTIPNDVIIIGKSAFYNCTGLSTITIPSSVETIETGAFYGCTGLTSITIPSSVTSINNNAFYGCSNLTRATFETTSGWWYSSSATATSGTTISASDLSNTSTAATRLKTTYVSSYWGRTTN